jgi:hypothetical protein
VANVRSYCGNALGVPYTYRKLPAWCPTGSPNGGGLGGVGGVAAQRAVNCSATSVPAKSHHRPLKKKYIKRKERQTSGIKGAVPVPGTARLTAAGGGRLFCLPSGTPCGTFAGRLREAEGYPGRFTAQGCQVPDSTQNAPTAISGPLWGYAVGVGGQRNSAHWAVCGRSMYLTS